LQKSPDTIKDHEFPWIELRGLELFCTRCGKIGDVYEWMNFLTVHGDCEEQGKIASE
jgi:hypothetical protein